MPFIHELADRPAFTWDHKVLVEPPLRRLVSGLTACTLGIVAQLSSSSTITIMWRMVLMAITGR